jgi:hypothetical protein
VREAPLDLRLTVFAHISEGLLTLAINRFFLISR